MQMEMYREKKRNKTAKAKRVILILFKMFPKDIFGHFHHAVNLILFFFAFTFFNTSRINETSSGLKRSPCRFAFVISASITGASSFPDFPFVCFAAVLISSSLSGSIVFIAGWFIQFSIVKISFR